MKYLIVVPARGGSKGIPGKNIYPINGKPLLEYTIETALAASIDNADIVVSTDSEKIKEVACKYNKIYVVDRPEEISGDNASTESALIHALDYMEEKKQIKYDAVVTLQATSPLRKPDTLKNFIAEYERLFPEYNALLSLNEDRTDFWKKTEGAYTRLFPNAPRRRQEREPLYIENSAYYITCSDALRKSKSILGTKVNGFVIDEYEAVDINEIIDIYITEGVLSATNNK